MTDLVNRLVPELFGLGLDLAACVALVREPARGLLSSSIGRLDDLISELRTELRSAGTAPTRPDDRDARWTHGDGDGHHA